MSMKKGECIILINPDAEEGMVDWVKIYKQGSCEYEVSFERGSVKESHTIDSSARVRNIIKTAEQNGYRREREQSEDAFSDEASEAQSTTDDLRCQVNQSFEW